MTRRFVVVAAILAVSAGCAAIVGLEEPSPIEEAVNGDGSSPDAPPSPPNDAGNEAAVAPDIGYGNESDGPVVITDRKSVNEYAPLAASAGGGSTSIKLGKKDSSVTTIPVSVGQVLLLVQSALPGVKPPLNTSPLDTDVGTWELVRVKAVNGDVFELEGPLVHAFSAPGAQAVRVLQAKTVDVGSAGAIAPPKWDGLTGGIVAILATESIVVTGQIDTGLVGYRAGRGIKSGGSFSNCTAMEGIIDAGFAPRGEGFGSADAGYGGFLGGRGNLGNGGGGGDCTNAGGGGGGNGGRGGQGGASWSGDGSRDAGGYAGAALKVPSGVSRLRFGGGGGAGESDDNVLGHGGAGGGVIFIRAPKLTGTGNLTARGGAGTDSNSDGAGGGGGGGTIYLDLKEAPSCGRLVATGGNGGNCGGDLGPGGGGGGGLLFIRELPPPACTVDFLGGVAGKDGSNSMRGAAPTDDKRDAGPFVGIISNDLAP